MKIQTIVACILMNLAGLVASFAQLPPSDPRITPADSRLSLSATATFRVTHGGTIPCAYQWHYTNSGNAFPLDGAANPSALSATLNLTNLQPASAGGYFVVVTNAWGNATSPVATLAVDTTFVKITEGPLVNDSAYTETSTWWDYDNNGLLDVVVSTGVGRQAFYLNNGDGTFTCITTNTIAQANKNSLVGACGDVDNDGDPDFYVATNYRQVGDATDDLFRNDGNGQFSAVVGAPWVGVMDRTFDCSFVDVDRDGLLDIFACNWNLAKCLYHQTVGGAFTKLPSAQAGSILENFGQTEDAAWADCDNDGDPDVWMSKADGGSRLCRNDGQGYFSLAATPTFGQSPGRQGTWADVNNDGLLDLFVGGNNSLQANVLYLNRGNLEFTNVAAQAGVGLVMTAWASAAGDFDNDGWLDLFVADWQSGQTNVLFHNRGDGTFEAVDVGSPIRDGMEKYGVRWVDYDNDGFLDLFITCGNPSFSLIGAPNCLYRNNGPAVGNTNHWLKLKLNGQASNRSGIGAKIRVKANIRGREVWQLREITGDGRSQPCPGLVAHFGLGDATKADLVRIEWPSGNAQELTDIPAGQTGQAPMTITEQVLVAPVRPSASLGGSVTLTSQPSGATAWQWCHDGVALNGQIDQTLALSNITTNDAGRYSVVVTTDAGTFTNHVYLLVDTQFERIEMGDTTASWGCAWGDYNNDGYPDLFVAEGASYQVAPPSLYRALASGTLVKVTPEEAGDIAVLERNWWCPAWGDYDNDGFLDLFVTDCNETSVPMAVLWRNLGNGRFGDATDMGSFASDQLWCVPIWGDFNQDGSLDLFVAKAYYEPPAWDDRNALYFNRGDGTFRTVTEDPIVAFRGQLQGGSAGDADGDGDLDILLTGSSGVALFENDGTGRFRQAIGGFPSVPGLPITPSWADYDNDGRLDVFLPVYRDSSTSRLLHNDGNGQWTQLPMGAVLENVAGMWADYDNDGDLDLFITRGQSVTTTNLLFANNGDGTFTQITLGSLANDLGRSAGCAWADYDNNGFQDLFVTSNPGYPEVLYRNHGNGNHWISFKLVGTASNRSAIGAKVRVYATISGKTYWQMREIGGGNRHQNDLRPHFGLGNATGATTVRIEWPSGTVQELSSVTADQVLTVWEPPFLRAAMQPNGSCELTVTAEPNRSWRLEGSSDLSDWQVLTTVTNTTATFRYTDPASGGMDCRFYRVLTGP